MDKEKLNSHNLSRSCIEILICVPLITSYGIVHHIKETKWISELVSSN